MGKRIRVKVDRSIDRSYPAGSQVMFVQHALTRLGIISFQGQAPLYDYHGELANKSFRTAYKQHQKVLELPVEKPSQFRRLDNKQLAQIYKSGSELVMNTYLLFEHFSRYMLGHNYLPGDESIYFGIEDKELKEKLRHIIVEILHTPKLLRHKGYGVLFSDWEKARHAINHPKFENLYSADRGAWDSVPIAWMVGGKHLDAFHDITQFFNELLTTWEPHASTIVKPGTITNMEPIVSDAITQPKKIS